MFPNNWLRRSALAAVLCGLAACAGDGPMGAGDQDAPAAGFSAAAGNDAWRQEHERLKEVVRQAKERFKAERGRRHQQFVAARSEWKLYKKALDERRKNGLPIDLLRCEPQEYYGDAELIGPEGGVLHIGKHTLTIPAGALQTEQVISGEAPVSELVEVELGPHGLNFARDARLALNYDHCAQPTAWRNLFIVYLGDQDQVIETTVSRDKKGIKTVVGDLEHFSRYAVAW